MFTSDSSSDKDFAGHCPFHKGPNNPSAESSCELQKLKTGTENKKK